jgi:thioredoxin-related protein
MKKFTTITLMLLAVVALQAQQINWMTFDQAVAAQKKNPKPIFMDVYTDWCGPCKMLDKNTFQTTEVSEYINKNFYAVKFNGEGNEVVNHQGEKYTNPNFNPEKKGRNSIHQFTEFLKLEGYPSMFVVDAKGKILKVIVGYYQPTQLIEELTTL